MSQSQGLAVIGYACRTPGAATVAELWDIVYRGRDVVTRASTNIGATAGGRVHAYGTLPDFDLFDEDFFGYSPREATEIDPQQRLLLECAVEAVESAALRLADLDVDVGVYAATGLSGYLLHTFTPPTGGLDTLPALIGGDGHYAATRIAYKLGLTGPAVAVGSACSSSLLAIHLAAQAILAGECDLALAGGMDIEFPQPMSYLYQDGGVLSRDGVCRPFDRAANGTVFASGGGLVVLADAELARRHGWPIRAMLLGSAVNNDGAEKVSFTAPRGGRQRDVIDQALRVAGMAPTDIGYVECHGTATNLGDRTELGALREVFGTATMPPIGSVKGNLGHLRVGAGVVSFIKACEMAARRTIPPNANVTDPMEPAAGINVPRPLSPPAGDPNGAVAIGVSSFGFGGTNVHAVVGTVQDSGITVPDSRIAVPDGGMTALDGGMTTVPAEADEFPLTLTVSAPGPESCLATARALSAMVVAEPGIRLTDMAHTLRHGRDDRAYRYAVVGDDRAALAAGLNAPEPGVVEGWRAETGDTLILVPGQGRDVRPFVRALDGWEPAFTASLHRLWSRLQARQSGVPDLPTLLGADGELDRATSHALHTAAFVALHDALRERGVPPGAVAGYSLGEYAAAAIAGALDPSDAVELTYRRGVLLADAPAGDMVVVQADSRRLAEVLPGRTQAIAISARRTVVACLADDLTGVHDNLRAAGIAGIDAGVGVPYHSSALAPLAASLDRLSAEYPTRPADRMITTGEAPLDAHYWAAQLANPIDFTRVASYAGAVQSLTSMTVVDLGDGNLTRSLGDSGADVSDAVRVLPSGGGARDNYLRTLARLWVRGFEVDPSAPANGGRLIGLPPRRFDRRRHSSDPVPRTASARAEPGRRGVQREPSIDRWAYYPSWRLRRRAGTATAVAGQRWLVFDGGDAWSASLVRDLTGRGVDVVRIGVRDAEGVLAVRPDDEASVKAMVAGLGLAEAPVQRIVHLWCTGELRDGGTLEARLHAMQSELDLGFYPLLYTIQELTARQGTAALQLDIVARGVHPVDAPGETLIPERALLLGPALVVPQDLPFVSARTIDITGLADASGTPSPTGIAELCAELLSDPVDRAVAFGQGQRWVRGYEPGELPALDEGQRPRRLRERGVYLITGGLGGIGMTLAEYLVDACQARLVLTALESVPDERYWSGADEGLPDDAAQAERVQRIRKLVAAGGEVMAVRCDASSPEQMRDLFENIDARFGRLDGVVHAAGVFETQRAFRGLEDTTKPDCERRLRPKVDGTLVLAECLRGRDVDFVLMQSSLSAQLGGLGFYAYTAGNAYMDAFAERHRDAATGWMSVNWDGWIFRERDVDAAHQSVVSPSFASPDFGVVAEIAIRPSEGAHIYGRLMHLIDAQQVLISTADFEQRYEQWVRHPLSALPVPTARATAGSGADIGTLDEVTGAVAGIWRDVLGVADVGADNNFFALGGDSLLGVSLAYRLGQAFGVPLSVITMFDRPTVAAMAEEIRRLAHNGTDNGTDAAAGTDAGPAAARPVPVGGEIR
jgi:phthiocerol/phenolphthiocerol synthesis type-I polyketide synthase E